MNQLRLSFFTASFVSILLLPLSAGAQFGGGEADEGFAVATDEPTDRQHRDFCRCIGEADSPAVAKIERVLSEPLKSEGFDFVDTALEEVVAFTQDEYGIPVQLDTPALDDVGLGPDEPVTAFLHNISLRSALRLTLSQIHLTYVIQNGVLVITTPEKAEASLLTCVYDVRDLLPDASQKSIDRLIDTIISCVATKTWAENGGGEAEMRVIKPGLLVISQIRPVHDEIRGLLAAVRELQRSKPAPAAATRSLPEAENVVTRSYVLQVKAGQEADPVRAEVRRLILQTFPDIQWNNRLDNAEPIVLAVVGDRIVVRHVPAVQEDIEELLRSTGIAVPSHEAGRRRGGFGGGGIFQPKPNPFRGAYGMSEGRPGDQRSLTPAAAN